MANNSIKFKYDFFLKAIQAIFLPFLLFIIVLYALTIKLKYVFQESLWPDEALYLYIARNLADNPLNLFDISGQLFYKSPPFLMYLISAFADIPFLEFDQISRLLIALMATGLIVVTYFTGTKIFNPVVGMVAGALMAACPLTNWIGVRILTDIPVTFFIYLAICMLAYGKTRLFYIFAVLSVLTKYTAFPVLFLPFLMKLKPGKWKYLYLGLFVSILIFVKTKSYINLPGGWINYFYNFFGYPNISQLVGESRYFLGLFVIFFAIVGFFITIKEEKYSAVFHWFVIFGIFRIFLPWVIFRVSRYTLPLYPALFIFAAYGCYQTGKIVASNWPAYKTLAFLFFVIAISSVLFNHTMKGFNLLSQTENSFVGFKDVARFIKTQPKPHVLATASPRQMKYFGPEIDVYDIGSNITEERFKIYLEKNNINYFLIDFWSPHLPRWCQSFDYQKHGYQLIYHQKNIYLWEKV